MQWEEAECDVPSTPQLLGHWWVQTVSGSSSSSCRDSTDTLGPYNFAVLGGQQLKETMMEQNRTYTGTAIRAFDGSMIRFPEDTMHMLSVAPNISTIYVATILDSPSIALNTLPMSKLKLLKAMGFETSGLEDGDGDGADQDSNEPGRKRKRQAQEVAPEANAPEHGDSDDELQKLGLDHL